MLGKYEIYFSDLNEDAQEALMKLVGIDDPAEMNWDIDMAPLAIYEVELDDPDGIIPEFPEDDLPF